jgi:hypothetical protein
MKWRPVEVGGATFGRKNNLNWCAMPMIDADTIQVPQEPLALLFSLLQNPVGKVLIGVIKPMLICVEAEEP